VEPLLVAIAPSESRYRCFEVDPQQYRDWTTSIPMGGVPILAQLGREMFLLAIRALAWFPIHSLAAAPIQFRFQCRSIVDQRQEFVGQPGSH
jgi:hypothetical protein